MKGRFMETLIILAFIIGIPAILTMRKVAKNETASKLGLSVFDKWLKR
jgi:hypothetical protein